MSTYVLSSDSLKKHIQAAVQNLLALTDEEC